MKKATIKHPILPNEVLTIYVDDNITGIMQLRERAYSDCPFSFGCGIDIFKTESGNQIMTTTSGFYANDFVEFVDRYIKFGYYIEKASSYGSPCEYAGIREVYFCNDPIFDTPNQPIDGSALFLKSIGWQDIDKSEFIND